MTGTYATVIAAAQNVFPDLRQADALLMLDDIDDLVRQVLDVYTTPHGTPKALVFSSGTKEVALTGVAQVQSVAISGNTTTLYATSVNVLTRNFRNFRVQASGTPDSYYVVSTTDGTLVLGLHPTPNANITVNVWGTLERTSSGITSTALPKFAGNQMVYLQGLLWRAAQSLAPGDADRYFGYFQQLLTLATAYRFTYTEDLKGEKEEPNARG